MSREQLLQTLWGENRSKVILVVVLLLLSVAVQIWQNGFLESQLATARTNLRNSQAELRSEKQRIEAGGGARISGLAEDLDHFYQSIPARSGLGSFIGRLYSYAADAGIDIAQINYVAHPVKDTRLLSYELSFTVDGSYAQLKKFIHLLENSPSLMILQSIALDAGQKNKEASVGLQLQLQTFFREAVQ